MASGVRTDATLNAAAAGLSGLVIGLVVDEPPEPPSVPPGVPPAPVVPPVLVPVGPPETVRKLIKPRTALGKRPIGDRCGVDVNRGVHNMARQPWK